jgi:hypothetical protein
LHCVQRRGSDSTKAGDPPFLFRYGDYTLQVSAMNDLSDDERNLLRYYAEQSASSMGWCECPSQHLR